MAHFLSHHISVTPHPSDPLVSLSQNLWVPSGARGVFGGQILAQSIMAATATVTPPLGIHSAHCYFLSPAQPHPTIEYRVEKLSDGRSYSSRVVRAWQGDKDIFVLMASYSLPPKPLPPNMEEVVDQDSPMGKTAERHTLAFSVDPPRQHNQKDKVIPKFEEPFPGDVRPPQECEEDADFLESWLKESSKAGKKIWERKFFEEYIQERRSSPVSIARARTKSTSPDTQINLSRVRLSWLRPKALLPKDHNPEVIKAMIAYMSDFQFIGTAARVLGLNQNSSPRLGMLASLDHAIHFYPFPDNFDPSSPLLHVMEAQAANLHSGRGIARGRIYTTDGHLIATTGQEGVVRASVKGRKAKGLIEGGMADVKEGLKAKL